MSRIDRRDFHSATLACLGTSLLGHPAAAEEPGGALPTVRWGEHNIARVLIGHNPLKGVSHFSAELNREMRQYFADEPSHGLQVLRRAEQSGINTCQVGGRDMERLLRAYHADGGRMQWIATFYSKPGGGKDELRRLLAMNPRPIGVQHFGAMTDRLMKEGRIDRARDTLKMLRDSGLLVGLCTHNHQVIEYAEEKDWDVDFYQCSFYHVRYGIDRPAGEFNNARYERFEEKARRAMVDTIRQASKPCIAFKVLAANRHCRRPDSVRRAIRFALENIKPSDVVLLGMWQKHRDQVAENVGYAREVLARKQSG